MTFVFVAAVFGSGYLLFLVQPLIAKQILPSFGGSASVWAVCLVFYQIALLAGYLYAHAITRLPGLRLQALVHSAVVLLSLLALPIGLDGAPPAAGRIPEWQIIWTLVRSIGLPYFVLSATTPLVQSWYAETRAGVRAYRLFSLSNLACTLSLLSFPLWWEARYPLSLINSYWSWTFGVEVVLLLTVAVLVAKSGIALARNSSVEPAGIAPGVRQIWGWVLFSALGSAFLVATSTHLCQTVAPIPFLWILPLLLYLLTFVIVFERDWYRRWCGVPLALLGIVAMSVPLVFIRFEKGFLFEVALYSIGMFTTCLFCHGELSARKPATAHLTLFYIVMAAGGAMGSVLVALAAPALFRGYIEFPLLLASLAVLITLDSIRRDSELALILGGSLATLLVVAGTVQIIARVYVRPVATARNFYGSLWIKDQVTHGGSAVRQLMHGTIIHGSQFLDGRDRMSPTTYYSPATGVGRWLLRDAPFRRVGVIGLGAGTLAAYGRPGDHYRFYEINPLVPQMASRYFGYIKESPAKVEFALGDARLVLESERPQEFDLLVVDAFSGDSIPLHLITTEAMRLYLRHLKPDGALAYHISNQYLELYPQLARQAEAVGLVVRLVRNPTVPERDQTAAHWILAVRRESTTLLPEAEKNLPAGSPRIWTDDYSSLLSAVKY